MADRGGSTLGWEFMAGVSGLSVTAIDGPEGDGTDREAPRPDDMRPYRGPGRISR